MYEGTQLQRKIETAIREAKDTQILAKASCDEDLVLQSQTRITQLNTKYKQLSQVSGLPTKKQRLSVSGYRRKKVDLKQYYENNLIGLKKGDIEIKEVSQHLYDRQKERNFKMVDLMDAFINPLDYGKITYNSKEQKSIQFIGKNATIYVTLIMVE